MKKQGKPSAAGSAGKKAKQKRFVAVILHLMLLPFIWILKDGRFVQLDEPQLDKLITGYSQEPLPERERLLKRFLRKCCKVKRRKTWKKTLPNSSGKVPCKEMGKKRKATADDLRFGAFAFLSIPYLFSEQKLGKDLMGDLICGLVCTRLREAFPEIHFISSIKNFSSSLFMVLSSIFEAVVTKTQWKEKPLFIRRHPVHNLAGNSLTGCHIWDNSYVQLTWKDKSATAHLPFQDTVVLLAKASIAQTKESLPLLHNCFSLHLDCAFGKDVPRNEIPAPSPGEHAQEALQYLQLYRYECSALLELWRRRCQGDPYWIERIAATVRSSFTGSGALWGENDALRPEIRAAVLADFLDFVRENGYLTADEIEEWHGKVTSQQALPDASVLPPADSAEAVIEVMRRYVAEHGDDIVPDGTPASAEAAKGGVWRTIGGKTNDAFLMLTEPDFASLYRRLAKAAGLMPILPVNPSDWLAQVLKNLQAADVNKVDGTTYRFRYRLLDHWDDKDYVVALKRSALMDDPNTK